MNELDVAEHLLLLIGGLSAIFFALAVAASIADAISRQHRK